MSIGDIISINTMEIGKYAANRRSRETALPARKAVDSYEPSGLPVVEDRNAMLSSIRSRIKNGYYNSEEVVDDLSNSFAKVLDKLL
jgi:hypothetical protein